MPVLEIVFVGQCEVCVCLEFVDPPPPPLLLPLGREAHRSVNSVDSLKKFRFF